MAVTIKNPRTIELVRELARATGQTQVAAVTQAVSRAIEELAEPHEDQLAARRERLQGILEEAKAARRPGYLADSKRREADLFGPDGLAR
ncbi:MAG: type II toxin-antitoxin system VapB family antitoxin [Bifidobacteriaceae bacterium]|nr:type II toxin-antitoxin system VapB family antitoxin [Bifidobacteriaceae bacterium]